MRSAAEAVAAYVSGMSGASERYKSGVQAVQTSPTAQAAAALPRYLQGVNEAVSSGRMAAALNNVSLEQWKSAAINKGAARLASGASAAKEKMAAHFNKWMPIYANIKSTIAQMPKGGTANALARVQATIMMLKQAAGKSD